MRRVMTDRERKQIADWDEMSWDEWYRSGKDEDSFLDWEFVDSRVMPSRLKVRLTKCVTPFPLSRYVGCYRRLPSADLSPRSAVWVSSGRTSRRRARIEMFFRRRLANRS
jgi:hypothetical protein